MPGLIVQCPVAWQTWHGNNTRERTAALAEVPVRDGCREGL